MWVRLNRDWTDPVGVAHTAGDILEVDAVTMADLEASGAGEAPVTLEGLDGTWLPTFPDPQDGPCEASGPAGVRPGLGRYAQDDTVIVSGDADGSTRPDPEPRREPS